MSLPLLLPSPVPHLIQFPHTVTHHLHDQQRIFHLSPSSVGFHWKSIVSNLWACAFQCLRKWREYFVLCWRIYPTAIHTSIDGIQYKSDKWGKKTFWCYQSIYQIYSSNNQPTDRMNTNKTEKRTFQTQMDCGTFNWIGLWDEWIAHVLHKMCIIWRFKLIEVSWEERLFGYFAKVKHFLSLFLVCLRIYLAFFLLNLEMWIDTERKSD